MPITESDKMIEIAKKAIASSECIESVIRIQSDAVYSAIKKELGIMLSYAQIERLLMKVI